MNIELNEEQKIAVNTDSQYVLVQAGAGSGKTRVLTSRIERLVREGSNPAGILAVTFTNKAANEMRERLNLQLGEELSKKIWIGTFHGISYRILQNHPKAAGLMNNDFRLLDDADQTRLMEAAFDMEGLLPDSEKRMRTPARAEASRILKRQIESWKEKGVSVNEAIEKGEYLTTALAYKTYQESLMIRNVVDFTDLILMTTKLIESDEQASIFWPKKFEHILVDEYQDTNPLQSKWLRALSSNGASVFCVGDTDQSIYRWRGAEPSIMENFATDWKNAEILSITQNYRSTEQILNIANKIVAKTTRKYEKSLKSNKEGDVVSIEKYDNHDQENAALVKMIQEEMKTHSAEDIAILFRSNDQLSSFANVLEKHKIQYQKTGNDAFGRREEVQDCLAYLRVAIDPKDTIAFERILNKPTRGISEESARVILKHCGPRGDVIESLNHFKDDRRFSAISREGIKSLHETLVMSHGMVQEIDSTAGDIIDFALTKTAYRQWMASRGERLLNEKESNIALLIDLGKDETDINGFINNLTLSGENKPLEPGKIVLSTMHSAKGLEFEIVATPCMENGIFPNQLALKSAGGLDEERRLAHVAWTRARKRLYVSWAGIRNFQAQKPSMFLNEAELELSFEPLVSNKKQVLATGKKYSLRLVR